MLSPTLTWSICSFHNVSFTLPLSSATTASTILYVSSLKRDLTSRGSPFSTTFASTLTRFIPFCKSLIAVILSHLNCKFPAEGFTCKSELQSYKSCLTPFRLSCREEKLGKREVLALQYWLNNSYQQKQKQNCNCYADS